MKTFIATTLLCQLALSETASAGKRPVATPIQGAKLYAPKKGSLTAAKPKVVTVKRSVSFRQTRTVMSKHGFATGHIDVAGYLPGDELNLELQEVSGELGHKPGDNGLRVALRGALRFAPHEGIFVGMVQVHQLGNSWVAGDYRSRFTLPNFEDFDREQTFSMPMTSSPNAPFVISRSRTPLSYRVVMKRDGKALAEHYDLVLGSGAWVTKANVYASPVYENAEGRPEAVVLGLAAFPVGANITIVDMTSARNGEASHATSGRASTTTGSARLVIPGATPGHEYRVTVGGDASAQFTFRLPAHDHPLVAKNGMGYFAIKEFEVEQ